jgi:hypothetical protein
VRRVDAPYALAAMTRPFVRLTLLRDTRRWFGFALSWMLLALSLASVSAPATASAAASPQTASGKLALQQCTDSSNDSCQIVVMNADGTGAQPLTRHGSNIDPSWSPDGSRLVFASNRTGRWQLFTVYADGSHLKQLTFNASTNSHPAWSPDGSSIAFSSNRSGNADIWVLNLSGGLTQRTTNAASDFEPAWRPDGWDIAFTSNRSGRDQIWATSAHGLGGKGFRITSDAATDTDPQWSPDLQTVVYTSNAAGNNDVWKQPQSGDATNLTTNPASDQVPAYSPDGSQVVFESNRAGGSHLWEMQADGSSPVEVTSGSNVESHAIWAPATCDGTWKVEPSLSPSWTGNTLNGVWAASPTDVWAVGVRYNEEIPLLYHYDGYAWSSVTPPTEGILSGLRIISGDSPTSIWALGYYLDSHRKQHTYTVHYNGTRWSIVPSPDGLGTLTDGPEGVWATLTATDQHTGEAITTIYERQSGAWVKMPAPTAGGEPLPVSAIGGDSPTDVFAVGGGQGASANHGIVAHWDGSTWTVVEDASRFGYQDALEGVAASSPSDVIAVGGEQNFDLIASWDGSSWTETRGIGVPPLGAVAGSLVTGAWAIGRGGVFFVEHWDGTSWTAATLPHLDYRDDLEGVTLASGQAWAVGLGETFDGYETTLIERYC